MIGKVIKEIDTDLKVIGSPKGTLTITIRKGIDDTIATTMGTIDVSTIPGQDTYSTYKFVNRNNLYALQKNDKILAEYSGGNSSNYVGINTDPDDPYDGSRTCTVYYTVSKVYNTDTSRDTMFVLWA